MFQWRPPEVPFSLGMLIWFYSSPLSSNWWLSILEFWNSNVEFSFPNRGKKERYVEVYQSARTRWTAAGWPSHGQTPHGPSHDTAPRPGTGRNESLHATRLLQSLCAESSLGLMSPLSSPGFRQQPQPQALLPGMLQLPYWPYPTPPMSPANTFAPPVIPGLLNGHVNLLNQHIAVPLLSHAAGVFSFVHLRNLPYQASVHDVVTFLHGTGLVRQIGSLLKGFWWGMVNVFHFCFVDGSWVCSNDAPLGWPAQRGSFCHFRQYR